MVESATTTGRKRIPCPIDPSHLIFEDMVEKHIPICPRAKKRKLQSEQIYYQENINTGGHGNMYSQSLSSEENNGTTTTSLEWAQRLAIQVLEVHQRIFRHESSSSPSSSSSATTPIPASKLTWNELHDAIPLYDLSQPEIDAGLIEGFKANRIKSGGARHIPQLASLVGHLRSLQVFPSLDEQEPPKKDVKPLILLEMGAGRGMFGLAAAGVAAASEIPTRLIMVERTGSRSKADKIFRTLPSSSSTKNTKQPPYLKLDTVKWSRIECDLAHVNLPVVLEKEGCEEKDADVQVVVIAKHLCGAGTDLALKSMEKIRGNVASCVLATCCHGICDWKEYVGRDYLRQAMATESLSFGPDEFDLMRQWCAGSVASQNSNLKATNGDDTDISDNIKKEAFISSMNVEMTGEAEEDDEELEHNTGTNNEEEHPLTNKNMADESSSSLPASNRGLKIGTIVDSLHLECGIEGLGRACQRLIDHGRLEYLRNVIFSASTTSSSLSSSKLLHYIAPDVSPQNACLIGARS